MGRVRAKPWKPARKVLAPPTRAATPEQVAELAGQGMRTQEIALRLGCCRLTVWRIAKAARISINRPARIRGREQWQAAYEEHGPDLRAMARALGIGVSYIHRQLEAYGIRETAGADIGEDAA